MTPTLVAMILIPCVSALHQSALGNETVAFSCPNTVRYVYDQPAAAAPAKPEAAPAKPVAVKKAAPTKKKHRKKRRKKK